MKNEIIAPLGATRSQALPGASRASGCPPAASAPPWGGNRAEARTHFYTTTR